MILNLQNKSKQGFDKASKNLIASNTDVFELEIGRQKTATITILEKQELKIIADDLFGHFDLAHLKIILQKDSKLVITEKNNELLEECLEVEQNQNSTFVYQKLYLSSGNSILNLVQNGTGCNTEIQNIIIGQNLDLSIAQNIIQNGVEHKLDHKTKFILFGNSDFKVVHFGKSVENSENCSINQRIKGVILDSSSKVEMQPILEIDSDSATSNHGASVGEFDQNEIQYLLTRGLDRTQTQKILVDSFLNDFYNKIEPICVAEEWRG